MKCAIIGGGAAGFFSAITLAENNPSADVSILDSASKFLRKVKVSGGGRCNVTHRCFDPKELSQKYPRGEKELRAAFYIWQPEDTIHWFENRGVPIKAEDDGRMFPVSDNSQTIIDCLQDQAKRQGINLRLGMGVKGIVPKKGKFNIHFIDGSICNFDRVCLASGSMKSSPLSNSLEQIGHTIQPLAPSLFAFDIKDERLQELSGISVKQVSVSILPKGKMQMGPVLITHRGLSGPGILKLSAWEARHLKEMNHEFGIELNWLGQRSESDLRSLFSQLRIQKGHQLIRNKLFDELPRRLWEKMLKYLKISDSMQWAQIPRKAENLLIRELISPKFQVRGKTMNKEEFVTCGGVSLKEVNFKKMESRKIPHLYFAGECLDYDGITGGFNFQGAWTTGYIAGLAMARDEID